MDRGYSSFNMFETCNRLDNYTQHRKDMPDLHCILHAKNRHKKSYSKNTLDVNWDFGKRS